MATHMWCRILRHGCQRFSRRHLSRGFSSGSHGESITNVPLSKPVSSIPSPQYVLATSQKHDTQVTVLENGMRVASENAFGQSSTVGVLIDSGSRYEVAYPSGISHFLEKLAFCSTTDFSDRDKILQKLEEHGGICDCQGSRDTLIYAISAETKGLSSAIDILSDVILRPCITPSEILDTQAAVGFELESLHMNPNPEPLLMEMIHSAAYVDNTLGLPKICPPDNIESINKGTLYTYMKNFHVPERMVLAGVGMEHEELVRVAREYFIEKKTPIWLEDKSLVDPSKSIDTSLSQFTGGLVQVEKDLSNISLGPTPMPELAHVVIGLESCSHKDEDFVAFCVLNMLMGGGGSFSAGGPGKGMYTRFYLNVLNRYHWIHSATAFNHAYEDSGVFCVHASAHPDQLRDLLDVILRELVNMAGKVSQDELTRAKTQLQSMLLMNLESRPVMFEDVGRQVLATGNRKQPEYYYNLIGNVTESDVRRVASRMLKSKPAVAAYGSLGKMPLFEDIQTALASQDGQLPRRFSLFRGKKSIS